MPDHTDLIFIINGVKPDGYDYKLYQEEKLDPTTKKLYDRLYLKSKTLRFISLDTKKKFLQNGIERIKLILAGHVFDDDLEDY